MGWRWVAGVLVAPVAVLALGVSMTRADAQPMRTIEYHGIRPSDPGGRDGLRNPERGWRIETLIAEPPGEPAWGPAAHLVGKVSAGYSDDWWILDARHYEPDGLTLAQTYCYLDRYVGVPIPEEKLQWLQQSFDALRANGLKAVLRFAYERDMGPPTGPTLEDIERHLAQLKPLIRRNADVIFVMQAGFVGAWGEWHSSANRLEADHAILAAVVAGVLDALPPDRMTQVRVPKYKRWVLEQPPLAPYAEVTAGTAHNGTPSSRIGFHNDGFLAGETCGGTWTEPPLFSNPGNPEFDYMTRECPYVPVDGELFWADQGGPVDGLRAAVRLRLHHYSSFSLAHSFSGREGKPYSIDAWMHAPLSQTQARESKLPVSEGYFEGADGEPVDRTAFEYIRDHLGYRIELQRARLPEQLTAGGPVQVEVDLVNRGFSAFTNPRPVLIVLLGDGDEPVASWPSPADPRTWQPFDPADPDFVPLTHTVTAEGTVPEDLAPGAYRLGLWMPDAYDSIRLDPRYAVRVANRDVPWWTSPAGYAANILGEVTVER